MGIEEEDARRRVKAFEVRISWCFASWCQGAQTCGFSLSIARGARSESGSLRSVT